MSEPIYPAATERELVLQREVEALRQEVVRLKQQNEGLQIALETTAEHGDIIEDQLQNEILERERAELTLQSVLEVVSKKNTDLEIILQTTA
ncbi:MAG TPA: GGDEF domain-containing protein, partial [Acidobacteriota bacterium]|nr:GGDEF domain-containing protein [Acidobacteriota bacterium]